MNYQEFCRLATTPLTPEEMMSDEETVATPEEIQWRKGWQVLRAIRHRRAGHPTQADLRLIASKTNIVVVNREHRRISGSK